ncbi:MAG: lysylphosphatidylglycerol synthase transmembrane domain-containing protein [Candidatus Zixiibacteriota bacterium]
MDSANTPASFSLKKFLIFALKSLLILVIFYFVYLQFRNNWEDIKTFEWQFRNPLLLILSFFTALFSFFLFASTWSIIASGFGEKISLPASFKIFYLSNLGRYVPGKIWQLFGIIYVARQYGLSAEKATASFVISQLFMTVSAFLILAVSAQIEPAIIIDQIAFMGKGSAYLFTAAMVSLSLVVVIWPNWILALCNLVLRRLSRPELSFVMDKKVAPLLFLGYCFAWFSYGAAFWMLIKSIVVETDLGLIPSIGIFAGSYQIGYLALFAPGGLGPRELVMGQMLLPFLAGVAPMIAIISRIWTTVIEILASIISVLIKK